MQGKLERGPEEVAPREVVQSAPPSNVCNKREIRLCLILFYKKNMFYISNKIN